MHSLSRQTGRFSDRALRAAYRWRDFFAADFFVDFRDGDFLAFVAGAFFVVFRVDDFRADDFCADFRGDEFFVDFRGDDFFADFRAADFFGVDFFAADFFVVFLAVLRGGTLSPSRRASDRPIAIACLRLVTFLCEPPLRSVPALRSCMTFLTFACVFLPYFAMKSSLGRSPGDHSR
jgi:hypothetical protein